MSQKVTKKYKGKGLNTGAGQDLTSLVLENPIAWPDGSVGFDY